MDEKRVPGYPFDGMRQKEELVFKTYEYDLPFNYPNVTVWRKEYYGGEFHGMELFTRNQPTEAAHLGRVVPGEWTLLKTVFTVPAETAIVEFRANTDKQDTEDMLWIGDAFAAVVPGDWNEYDDVPEGTPNLISNPTFAGREIPPTGWKKDNGFPGTITPSPKTGDQDHAGLKLQGTRMSLYTEIPAQPGQRMVFTLWAKSLKKLPGSLWLFPTFKNSRGMQVRDNAGDCIIIAEDEPIVKVVVIGSACTPPGYVMLEAEPCEEFYRRGDFVRCVAPLRFRQSNLWGMHLRFDQWSTGVDADFGYEEMPEGMIRRYPGIEKCKVKSGYGEFPFTGMSCAVFEIPKSRKVVIQGGSESNAWRTDNFPDDDHYSFRTIRTTVAVRR